MSLYDDYGPTGPFYINSSAQCFALPPDDQVPCSAQHLNVSDPPSIYTFEAYSSLWEPIQCLLANVTYSDRWNLPNDFNFCSVPYAGQDAFLFVSLALLAAACLFGKLSAVFVLILGGIVGAINYEVNLREISNAISLWIGMQPPDLFFYAFLPPLLVDSAIRIDFFMFRKMWVHSLLLAFVMVFLSALILTPIILFAMGFAGRGWSWVYGALFAAIIAPTDALAATAVLKQGGGPEKLVVLMEGEALWNDASAFTLFEVFMHILEEHVSPDEPWPTVWSEIGPILLRTLKLAGIGLGIGWAMSIATGYLLRWLRWRGAKPKAEIVVIIAVAYLSFYVAQSPAEGSGVIAVVVFGLWGNFTSRWGMLSSVEEGGSFEAVWDTISFAANGLVFFWAGIAAINYFIRSISILSNTAWSYIAIPLIYIAMVLIRIGCITLFNFTIFKWLDEYLTWREILFTGWAGLRGAVSLILIADFVNTTALRGKGDPSNPWTEVDIVNGDISLWTASFVFLTLVINAPLIGPLMRLLRLDRIAPEKMQMRAKAKRALSRFTGSAMASLRNADSEFLQGANWEAVAQYVDVSDKLHWDGPPPPEGGAAAVVSGKDDSGGTDGGAAEDGTAMPASPSMEGRRSTSASKLRRMPSATGLTRKSGLPGPLRKVMSVAAFGGLGALAGRARSERGEESDTEAESGSERTSSWDSSDSGDELGLTECPYLDRASVDSQRGSVGSDSSEQEGDIEKGIVPHDKQQQQQQQQDGAGQGSPTATAAVSPQPAAAAAAAAAAVAAGVGAAAMAAAALSGGATGDEDDDGAKAIAALKRRQASQRRPQLGSLFAGVSPAEQPPAQQQQQQEQQSDQEQVHQQQQEEKEAEMEAAQAATAAAIAQLPPVRLPRPRSNSGLAPIVEDVQQTQAAPASMLTTGSGSVALEQAEEGAAPEAYYSSMPATVGRRMQQALMQELHAHPAGTSAAAPAISPEDGTAGGAVDESPTASMDRSPEQHYYSMPARLGQQFQRQLREQQQQQQQAAAGSSTEAGSSAEAGDSPQAAGSTEEGLIPRPAEQADPTPQPAAVAEAAAAVTRGPASAELYDSTPPARLGQQIEQEPGMHKPEELQEQQHEQQQQQQEQQQPGSPSPPGPSAFAQASMRSFNEALVAAAEGEEEEVATYSSMPAMQGRRMQQELKRRLQEEQRASSSTPSSPRAAAAAARQPSVEPADLQPEPTYSSLPAALGRRLQQQLQQQRQQQQQAVAPPRPPSSRLGRRPPLPTFTPRGAAAGEGALPPASAPGAQPPSPRAAAAERDLQPPSLNKRQARAARQEQQAGAESPSWEQYHHTLSGVTGKGLASEVRRQLGAVASLVPMHRRTASSGRSTPTAAPPTLPQVQRYQFQGAPTQQRDLLGRKIGAAAGAAVPKLGRLGSSGPPSLARQSAGPSTGGEGSGSLDTAMPSMPLSARLPSSDVGALAVTATPLSEALARHRGTPSGLPAPPSAIRHMSRHGAASIADKACRHPVLRHLTSAPATTRATGSAQELQQQQQQQQMQGSRQGSREATPLPGLLSTAEPGSASLLTRTYSTTMMTSSVSAPVTAQSMSVLSPRGPPRLDHVSVYTDPSLKGGGVAAAAIAAAGGGGDDDTTVTGLQVTLGASSDTGAASSWASTAQLAEMRYRLVAGLKRYFHGKRLSGLLSPKGLRILDYACDRAAEHTSEPLRIWARLEREVKGGWWVRLMARALYWMGSRYRSSGRWWRKLLKWPVKWAAGYLRGRLGARMLVACEVGVEFYLSMVHSPQIRWMQQTDEAWPLQEEVESEADAAFRFIIDKEIEAPDRFQAIQSYRAAMAVLRQALTFVHELYDAGMIDESEKDEMLDPLDRKMRHLEIVGPVWRPPRPKAILRSLPFMANLPETFFSALLEKGIIREFPNGKVFWAASDLPAKTGLREGPGGYVVLSGVIKRILTLPDGTKKEFFQGAGGVVGTLLAMTGTTIPGTELAIAEGNTLGKGPVLFHFPQAEARMVVEEAERGEPAAMTLRLELLHLATGYVLDVLDGALVQAVAAHVARLAWARATRSVRRRPHHQPSSPRHSQPHGGSAANVRPPLLPTRSSGRLPTPNQLPQLATGGAAPPGAGTGGSLTHASKSMGAGLAALMAQIAEEEFEELGQGKPSVGAPALRQRQAATEGAAGLSASEAADDSGHGGSLWGGSDTPNAGAGLSPRQSAYSLHSFPSQQQQQQGADHRRSDLHANGHANGQEEEQVQAKSVSFVKHRTRAAVRRAPQLATEVLADMRAGLPYASLVELPPGAAHTQTTHEVLLRGSLDPAAPQSAPASPHPQHHRHRRSSSQDGGPGGGDCVHPHDAVLLGEQPVAAPSVLPWLWAPRFRCNAGARAPLEHTVEWHAGRQGALLMAWLTEEGRLPLAVGQAEQERAARAEREAAAAEQPAGTLRSHPLNGTLRHISIARAASTASAGAVSAASSLVGVGAAAARSAVPAAASIGRRLLPWQHKWQHRRQLPAGVSTADHSLEGSSGHGSTDMPGLLLPPPDQRVRPELLGRPSPSP